MGDVGGGGGGCCRASPDSRLGPCSSMSPTIWEAVMAITAAEAKRDLTRFIEQANSDRIDIEIVAERGSAVLMSKDA